MVMVILVAALVMGVAALLAGYGALRKTRKVPLVKVRPIKCSRR